MMARFPAAPDLPAPSDTPLPAELAPAVLAACPIGVLVTSARTAEEGARILYVNPAFSRVTGYAADHVLGRAPRLLDGPSRSPLAGAAARAFRERTPIEGEAWCYRADGTPFLLRFRAVPIVSALDGRTCFFTIVEDVTELRRLEGLAEASNLMEGVGYVFSGIRHELGNPINSIKAAVTLLRRGLDHYSTERLASTLDRVLDEIRRVEYLLKDLRSFNALEQPAQEALEVGPFLERFVSLVRRDCETAACGVSLVIAPTAPKTAWGDARGLHQVLLNLAVNAIEAAKAQGLILLASPPHIIVHVDAGPGDTWAVDVEDNGPGIPEEILPQIFTPFFTTKRTGTGMGLALVRRVLARMGGTISVRSTVGAGSRFSVLLPLDPSREPS